MFHNLFDWNSFGQASERSFRVEFVDELVGDQNGPVGAFGKSVGLNNEANTFVLKKLFINFFKINFVPVLL